jgi:IgA-specific serine endopeptidase
MNNQPNEIAAVGATTAQAIAAAAGSQLITLDPAAYVAEVFKPFNDKFAILKAEADTIAPDASTTAGMEICVKYRAAFRDDVRVAGEKARVVRKAPILEIGKLLDSKYAELKKAVVPYEAKFDAAIKAEEKRKEDLKRAEAEREEKVRLRIVAIRDLPLAAVGKPAAAIAGMIAALEADVPDDSFGKLLDAAMTARAEVMAKLAGVHTAAVASEEEAARIAAERVELAQLREAAAERQRLAQVEADRVAAAQKAEADRLLALAAEQEAAALREREAAAAKLKAEADAQAEANRVAQAEIDLQRAELAEQQAAAQAERDAAERTRVAGETKAQLEQKAKAAAAERTANEQAVTRQATHTRESALAEANASIASAAAANVAADAAAAPVPAGAAPEIARTATFYGDAPTRRTVPAPASAAAPADLFDQADRTAESDIEFLSSLADAKDMTLADLIDRITAIDFEAVSAELAAA